MTSTLPAPTWISPKRNGRALLTQRQDDRYYDPANIAGKLLTTAALADLPPLEPLVNSYLYRDTLAMLYGPSGGGKTFLSVAWALHVATGSWWEGHRVEQTPVLYVIAEGARMVGQRVDAWTDHHGRDLNEAEPIHWHPAAINLSERNQAEALATVAADLGVGLVVIDTLARCAVGAEENSAKDMGRLVDHCDLIRAATQACVLLVHHSGKDAANGARGSSVLRAAMDTEVSLDAAGTLTVTKAKDWSPPAAMSMSLQPIAGSCVMLSGNEARPRHADAALDALRCAYVPGGVSSSVWLKACDGVPERSFYRLRSKLLESGEIVNVGTDSQPRYAVAEMDR